MSEIIIDEWAGCYPSKWKSLIVPEAIAHPAKFSSKLIRRIYEHMREGWLPEGSMVIDPFGGVALGALDAMRLGLSWRGIELETRFADLGNQNIALWNKRFSTMPHWSGDAVLLNGDSRNLAQVLAAADACVSSPPYSEARIGQESGQEHCGRGDQYGATPGQLGSMKANGFEAAVSSPPFGAAQSSGGIAVNGYKDTDMVGDRSYTPETQGNSDCNLSVAPDTDFWAAAREIVDQVYQVLEPSGHAVWILKDFVKNKARVPFCGQWRQLCEAAGFVTLHEHHALQVHQVQHDFDGKEKRRESKSFFRCLAEKNGSPRIDYEVVLCMAKLMGED